MASLAAATLASLAAATLPPAYSAQHFAARGFTARALTAALTQWPMAAPTAAGVVATASKLHAASSSIDRDAGKVLVRTLLRCACANAPGSAAEQAQDQLVELLSCAPPSVSAVNHGDRPDDESAAVTYVRALACLAEDSCPAGAKPNSAWLDTFVTMAGPVLSAAGHSSGLQRELCAGLISFAKAPELVERLCASCVCTFTAAAAATVPVSRSCHFATHRDLSRSRCLHGGEWSANGSGRLTVRPLPRTILGLGKKLLARWFFRSQVRASSPRSCSTRPDVLQPAKLSTPRCCRSACGSWP